MSDAPVINTSNETSSSPEPTSHPVGELESSEVLQNLRESTTTATTTNTTTSSGLPVDLALSLDSLQEQGQEEREFPAASYYWDASTMNARSRAVLARLRSYKPPPFPTWDRLDVSRRAAVLVLLFADRRGDLRVVITMRAASLRNFSERAPATPAKDQIARREAWEEIGLPMDDAKLPKPFRIEPLCELPCSLAKTEVVVRPCVAFLHSDESLLEPEDGSGGGGGGGGAGRPSPPTVEERMMPRLDAKEVAAVFSAPFHNFLKARDELSPALGEDGGNDVDSGNGGSGGNNSSEVAPPPPPPPPPGNWYDGYWAQWHGEPWRVHNFHVPVNNQRVSRPRRKTRSSSGGQQQHSDGEESGQAAIADELEEEAPQRFLVWGFTGRILVDAARVAYAEEPEFEHNAHFGDEPLIARLEAEGRLPEKKRRPAEVGLEATREVVNETKI